MSDGSPPKHAAARAAAQPFETRLRTGDRVTARWKLLDIRVSAPATIVQIQEDCVQVVYGTERNPPTTRWLPLSGAQDWSPDHGVFPVLEQLWVRATVPTRGRD